jgi:hypothetical protein
MKKHTLHIVVVDGKEWPYKVSPSGDIFTTPNRYNGYKIKKLIPRTNHGGYLRITLSSKGAYKQTNVNRVVAEAFIPNPNNYPFTNHINGIKTDNRVENIEWCTCAQNTHHAVDNGLIKSKINSTKVRKIKELLISGIKGGVIAEMYGVSTGVISRINTGKIWSNL